MIIYFLLQAARQLLAALRAFLPDASRLPTVGTVNFDTFVSTGIGYFKGLENNFPPFATLLICASIFLGYKLTMMIIKAIFGSRAPSHNHN